MESYIDKRPWGKFEQFTHNELSTVKLISVSAGKRLSLQYHNKRNEFWRILSGRARVTLGENIFDAVAGDDVRIAQGVVHRIEALDKDVEFLEISFGEFDENDNVRLEDDFGRNSPEAKA